MRSGGVNNRAVVPACRVAAGVVASCLAIAPPGTNPGYAPVPVSPTVVIVTGLAGRVPAVPLLNLVGYEDEDD